MELGKTFSCLIKDVGYVYIYRYVFKNLDLSSMVSIYLEYFLKYIAPAPILALRVRKAKG